MDVIGKGMRDTRQMANSSARVLVDKERVDYSVKEKRLSKTEFVKKTFEKKLYESMGSYLDQICCKAYTSISKLWEKYDRYSKVVRK